MYEDQQKQIAQQTYFEQSQNSQFRVAEVPFHQHNNVDSPGIPAQFLNYTDFMIWGQVQLSSGTIAITNANILSTSVVVVTSTQSTVNVLKAVCTTGTATITSSSGADNSIINFILIF